MKQSGASVTHRGCNLQATKYPAIKKTAVARSYEEFRIEGATERLQEMSPENPAAKHSPALFDRVEHSQQIFFMP
jgi:hypothetical protein